MSDEESAPDRLDVRFIPDGTAVSPATSADPAAGQRICPSCSTLAPADSRFCPGCGSSMEAASTTLQALPMPPRGRATTPYPLAGQLPPPPPPPSHGPPGYLAQGYGFPGPVPPPPAPYWQPAGYVAPFVYLSTGKSKGGAIALAIFFSWWTWLYTYERNKTKFWWGMGLGILGGILTLFIVGLVIIFAVWLWAVIDTIAAPDTFYTRYPNG